MNGPGDSESDSDSETGLPVLCTLPGNLAVPAPAGLGLAGPFSELESVSLGCRSVAWIPQPSLPVEMPVRRLRHESNPAVSIPESPIIRTSLVGLLAVDAVPSASSDRTSVLIVSSPVKTRLNRPPPDGQQ